MANGFLFDIKAVVDKQSFQNGIASIEKVADVSKKAILGITGIATALVATASKASGAATAEMKMANAIGMSSDALANWKTSASIAGASADGLVSSLSSIESKMQHLKMGEVDSGLAKNLAMMNIGYGEFANMDSNQRMATVFERAGEMQDQRMASQLIQDTLGSAGREYYDMLKLSGKSLKEQMAEAKALNFVSESSRKKAVLFGMEMRAVKEAGAGILKLFGMELAGAITPTIRKLKNFLISNRERIRKGIAGFAQSIGTVFNAIFGTLLKVAPLATGLIDNFGGLTGVVVKLGVGFASMKLLKVASGLKSVALGVKSIKSAVSGLAGGLATMGLGVLFEDVVSHFMGGNSLIFDYVIPKLKETFAELSGMGFEIDTEGIKNLIAGMKELWTNTEEVRKVLARIAGTTIDIAVANSIIRINDLVQGLTTVFNILSKIAQGDFRGALNITGNALQERHERRTNRTREGIEALSNIREVYENEGAGGVVRAVTNITTGGIEGLGGYLGERIRNAFTADDEVEDGIISPNGRVTQVSPNDWVFAVKDISDLASGFLPNVTTNNNGNTTNNATYTINQSFVVNGNGGNIRQQAYNGTAEALRATVNTANQRLQMMSGAR